MKNIVGIRKKTDINMIILKVPSVFLDSIFSKKPVSAVKARVVAIVKKPFGSFLAMSISLPSFSRNILSLTKVVFEKYLTVKGTPNKVIQKKKLDHKENSPDELFIPDTENAMDNPKLMPIQKTRFQSLFLVRNLTLSSSGIFLQNVAKSSMITCSNYWFKIYSLIISNFMRLLKGIMHCLVLFFVCLQGVCMAATPVNNRDRDVIKEIISKVEIQYKIPAGLLGAIAKVESGTRKHAVNANGRAIYAATLVEATTIAKEQISRGKTNIDLGVMQLNYRWHGDQFSSLEEMLIPEKNIAYAGGLLRSLYRQHGDWQKAIRHYHSANLKHSRKYSRKVTMAWLSN